eukprot:7844946-Pyramimonas_sp.AAC.1
MQGFIYPMRILSESYRASANPVWIPVRLQRILSESNRNPIGLQRAPWDLYGIPIGPQRTLWESDRNP